MFGQLLAPLQRGRQGPQQAVRALVWQVKRRRGFNVMRQTLALVGATGVLIGRCDPRLWERLSPDQHCGYGCENASKYHSTNTKSANVMEWVRHLPICSCVRGSALGRASAAAARTVPVGDGDRMARPPQAPGFSHVLRCPLGSEWLNAVQGWQGLLEISLPTQARRQGRLRSSTRRQASNQPTCLAPGARLLAIAPLFVCLI